ncbi:MAG: protease modulator HflK [Verrucomicrobia bacterium]|nr:protease modulator HflK [Verrucomicrobiota bacterium]
MERNLQRNGLVNLLALLAVTVAAVFVAKLARSLTGEVNVVFLGLGALVAAFSWFQMRLEAREQLEKLDFDELAKSKSGSALFTSGEADLQPARRAREQFERWFAAGFAVVLFALEAGAAYWFGKRLLGPTADTAGKSTIALALFGLFALVLFLLGKYSAGIARLEGRRLLRPGASFLLLGAYLNFLAAACVAADEFGYPKLDLFVARALCVILTLAAVETLLGLLLEIYRPRVKGQSARLLYESRLLGLLAAPEGIFTTAAHALDYQFGFRVSETWFYRFLERALAGLLLLQLGVLLLSTCVVFIEPGEQAILERCGAPVAGRAVLEPGLHFKLPWPVDRAHRYKTREIQRFEIGFIPGNDEHGHDEQEKTLLWAVSHDQQEFNLLVASREESAAFGSDQKTVPANLLVVGIPVQYQIDDLRAWAVGHANPARLLADIAARAVARHLVSVDINEIMSVGRSTAAVALRKEIQARADERQLGVKILFLGLQDIHPPVAVAGAYQEVVGALQDKEAKIQEAEGYRAKTLALAEADALKIQSQAAAFQITRTTSAAARAARFTNEITAFAAAPEVYPQRLYFQTLNRAAAGTRKFLLLATNTHDVLQLDLQEKVRRDLLDVQIPPVKK